MKLIVGLGNPGEKFGNTRHNVGFVLLDKLAKELGIKNFELSKKSQSLVINHQSKVVLAKPTIFMNESGISVKKLVIQYKTKMADLWVIHDDLDLRLGTYKIQKGVGPKLHYGVSSIEENLGNSDFWRVRIGVDNREKNERTPGEEYVLEKFSDGEVLVLENVIDQVTSELLPKLFQNEP